MDTNIYAIYVATKRKDGSIVKSECITTKAQTQTDAMDIAISRAKFYGYKGKVHICSIYQMDETKNYIKL